MISAEAMKFIDVIVKLIYCVVTYINEIYAIMRPFITT